MFTRLTEAPPEGVLMVATLHGDHLAASKLDGLLRSSFLKRITRRYPALPFDLCEDVYQEIWLLAMRQVAIGGIDVYDPFRETPARFLLRFMSNARQRVIAVHRSPYHRSRYRRQYTGRMINSDKLSASILAVQIDTAESNINKIDVDRAMTVAPLAVARGMTLVLDGYSLDDAGKEVLLAPTTFRRHLKKIGEHFGRAA